MTTFDITLKDYGKHNKGINAEMSLHEFFGLEKTKHDNIAYDQGSDIVIGTKNISVKSARFTLASGSKFNSNDFNEIVKKYIETTHSNTFIYITETGKCFEMNINEFVKFIYQFCTLQKDSDNTMKVRAKHESKTMIKWLNEMV